MNKHGPSEIYVKLTGERVEAFLNECMKVDIGMKSVQRRDNNTIEFYIPASNLSLAERIAENCHCSVEVLQPSFIEMSHALLKRRIGFFVGVILFFLVLLLLSQMVWNIEIEGAEPELEHNIEKSLSNIGLEIGSFIFSLPSADDIQKQILSETEGVTWIGVERRGTTYHFEIVEQSLPEKESPPAPRHITAKKTAVIDSIYAEKGQVMVKENELVRKGDILISGFIGKGKYSKTVPATGEVRGETWFKVSVEVPIKQSAKALTGAEQKSYHVKLFGWRIPIWRTYPEEEFKHYITHEESYRPGAWGWQLPAALLVTTFQEKTTAAQSSSVEEAGMQAERAAKDKLEAQLPGEAEIIGKKILHEKAQNGKVKLVIHYQVLEDITSETPIIQGE